MFLDGYILYTNSNSKCINVYHARATHSHDKQCNIFGVSPLIYYIELPHSLRREVILIHLFVIVCKVYIIRQDTFNILHYISNESTKKQHRQKRQKASETETDAKRAWLI